MVASKVARKKRKTAAPASSKDKLIKIEPPTSPQLQTLRATEIRPPTAVAPPAKTPLGSTSRQPPEQAPPQCPFPVLPLANPQHTDCFFNAVVQFLRVVPEAKAFFNRAYLHLPAALPADDPLRWSRDMGELLANEGKTTSSTVSAMRRSPYFPRELQVGQQDAHSLLNFMLGLHNGTAVQTLGQQLFDFTWEAERRCHTCHHVSPHCLSLVFSSACLP